MNKLRRGHDPAWNINVLERTENKMCASIEGDML